MKRRTTTDKTSVSAIEVSTLSTLFDSAPDVAFFVKDAKGCYVAVNNSLVRRHGLKSKDDVLGKRPRDICAGEFGQAPSEQDERILKTGRPLTEHLEMQWNPSHEPVWCLTTKLPITNSDGAVTGIVGFSRDVRIPVQPDEIPQGFASALKTFEENLGDYVTPSWLAEQSNLSPQQLTRFTRKVFDLTPTQLIARIRIAAASRMLRDSDDTVADIAFACGFYDHSAFTRAFRNAIGLTPSAFRAQS